MAANSGRVAALGFALLLAVVPALLVTAQTGETMSTGAMVNVAASGGDVRAAGAAVTVSGTAANIKAAGAEVNVSAEAAGSIWAVGARVTLSGPVAAAVKAGGASIALTGRVGGNADIAGAVVDINTGIGGDLRVGGASVTFGKETRIVGQLMAGGASVVFEGRVTGPARIGGASVLFNGTSDGSVSLAGASVVIGAGARIGGDLFVRSVARPPITEGAVITGWTVQIQPPPMWSPAPWVWIVVLAVAVVLGTVLAGIVLMLFGGRIFTMAADNARHRPMSSFLIGLIVAILIPAVAIILMATIVGISVGLAVLFLLPVLIVFGHAVAATGIAAGLFVRSTGPIGLGRAVLMLIAGAIIVVLIGLIPWVGMWAVSIVLVLGLGALARTAGAKLRAVVAPAAGA